MKKYWSSRYSLIGKTLAAFLAVFLVFEIFFRFLIYVDKPPQSYFEMFDAKYLVSTEFINSKKGKPVIVMVGDSLMVRGTYPELLSSLLNKQGLDVEVINLAVSGASADIAIPLLDLMIQSGVQPNLVLFNFEVSGTNAVFPFNKPNYLSSTRQALNQSYLGRCVLRLSSQSSYDKGICSLEERFYLVRYRGYFKSKVLEFLPYLFDISGLRNLSYLSLTNASIKEVSHAGWAPVHNTLDVARLEAHGRQLRELGPHNPKYEYSVEYLVPLIKYGKEHQMPVGFVWLPHYKPIYAQNYYRSPYTKEWYEAEFSAIASPKDNVYAININRLDDEFVYYDDYRHLNTYGAVKTTELLAQELSQEPFRSLFQKKSIKE